VVICLEQGAGQCAIKRVCVLYPGTQFPGNEKITLFNFLCLSVKVLAQGQLFNSTSKFAHHVHCHELSVLSLLTLCDL